MIRFILSAHGVNHEINYSDDSNGPLKVGLVVITECAANVLQLKTVCLDLLRYGINIRIVF